MLPRLLLAASLCHSTALDGSPPVASTPPQQQSAAFSAARPAGPSWERDGIDRSSVRRWAVAESDSCVSISSIDPFTAQAQPRPACGRHLPFIKTDDLHPVQPNHEVTTVHIVSQCHLDAGYKGPFVAGVLSEWFNKWIPHSISLSDQLRREGGQEQHRWTMSPWVASFFLDCPKDGAVWTEDNEYTRRPNASGTAPSFAMQCPNASTVASFRAAVARNPHDHC